MDCPHRIPPSGTPAHHHRPKFQSSCHSKSTLCHHHKYRYRCSQSRSQSHPHQYHTKSCHDSSRGHSRSHHRDNWWHHRSSSWHPHSTAYTHCSYHDTPHHRSSTHRSSSAYSRDCSGPHSQPAYKPTKKASHWSSSHSSIITRQNTYQKELKSYNRLPTNGQLQFRWPFQWLRGELRAFKLAEPSPSSASHEQGGLNTKETVTVACIMDCLNITVHARKHYKALTDSGAAI